MSRFVCQNRDLQPLIDAYVAETGIPVSWTRQREIALQQIHKLGYGPAEMRDVLRWIRRKVEGQANGFTDTSLLFRNAVEKWETFEERVLLIQQARDRKPKPQPLVPHVRELPGGKTVTVLGEAAPADPEAIAAQVREQAAAFRRQMGRE